MSQKYDPLPQFKLHQLFFQKSHFFKATIEQYFLSMSYG